MSVSNFIPAGNPGPFYGGVDAGGTKFLCAIGKTHSQIERVISIKTDSRQATLSAVAGFFNAWISEGKTLAGIGIATFGPLNRNAGEDDYGKLRNSPKVGWEDADMGAFIKTGVTVPAPSDKKAQAAIPLGIDTDVNGAALAEGCWGAARAKHVRHYAYVTVGTGIGVSIVANNELVNGIAHPELGHYRPSRALRDRYPGCCRIHGDCLEGMASGPAIRARTGRPAEELEDDHPVWDIVAHNLGHLCSVLLFAHAPQLIIIGGGVMTRSSLLLPKIRRATVKLLGGYLGHPLHSGNLENVIVPSGLALPHHGGLTVNAGVIGGFILAQKAAGHWKS